MESHSQGYKSESESESECKCFFSCRFLIARLTCNQNKKDGYHQLNVRQLGSLRPWDHRGKCYMDRKRIQCWSNVSQHVHIYLQPFTSYSEILVGNRKFFLPLAFNAPVRSGPWDNRGKCHTVGKRLT